MLGFLRSQSINNVDSPVCEKAVAKLLLINDFPSPGTELVTNNTFEVINGHVNCYNVPYTKFFEQRKKNYENQLKAYNPNAKGADKDGFIKLADNKELVEEVSAILDKAINEKNWKEFKDEKSAFFLKEM